MKWTPILDQGHSWKRAVPFVDGADHDEENETEDRRGPRQGSWSAPRRAELRCQGHRRRVHNFRAADGRPVNHPRWAEHGIASEKEAKILASL